MISPTPPRLLRALLTVIALQSTSVASIWISVDADGTAHTITPTTDVVGGATTTIDAVPYSLTGRVFTITQTDGAVTTSSGNPPPPRATDSDGGRGYFIPCRWNANSAISPFCNPRDRSELYAEEPYYITWDDHGVPEGSGRLVGYLVSSIGARRSNTPLFTFDVALRDGHHAWTPTESDLNGSDVFSFIELVLSYEGYNRTGPVVRVLPPRDEIPEESNDGGSGGGGGGGGGPNVLAIVLPIVFVVLAIFGAAFAFFVIRRRRRNAAGTGPAAKRVSNALGASGPGVAGKGRGSEDWSLWS
ncbi:hypothetical protein SODALDRAFT_179419 [Sodiomyces alkalinus F11]|uniref:Mid2 domain-containing protein n=1 Tax=Sodiomyces alkalinus (strain CBS 110278 / VKM F-3762 / F11) TaxID=1314773 RepID=A0A3N2PU66_SODAK|nr:hypothetical protein SODALDRAFT_179419 [Sodiomyces alkalinus F11]ROT38022.1 hypothetical protein SODALDRAFT_179419 [Sodiomyces alkalinus F11]